MYPSPSYSHFAYAFKRTCHSERSVSGVKNLHGYGVEPEQRLVTFFPRTLRSFDYASRVVGCAQDDRVVVGGVGTGVSGCLAMLGYVKRRFVTLKCIVIQTMSPVLFGAKRKDLMVLGNCLNSGLSLSFQKNHCHSERSVSAVKNLVVLGMSPINEWRSPAFAWG